MPKDFWLAAEDFRFWRTSTVRPTIGAKSQLRALISGRAVVGKLESRISAEGLVQVSGITRRHFLGYGLGVGATFVVPSPMGVSRAIAAAGHRLTKFIQPLPRPGAGIVVATPSAPDRYSFNLRQTARQLHPQLPETPFWGYDDGHLEDQAGSFGMAVVARTGIPLTLDFTNDLPATYPSWIPVDPELTFQKSSAVRIMTHLHGGFVAADSDGNPAVTEGFLKGATQTVYYPNQAPADATSGGMPASLLWFHDHAFGATRLNVFAGLAAAYILRDEFDTGAVDNPIGIPGGAYEIPLVIQDRQFNADGTFLYPTSDIAGVTWIGEYFGDVMLVNGMVWPFTNVEPRLYRLRILNGCNSRIMDLRLGVPMWQIGAEGGMWDRPVRVHKLVLAPAERADVIADFTHARGQSLVLQNSTPRAPVSTPAPALKPVMQFRVGTRVTGQGATSVPGSLPGRVADLPPAGRTRYITLNEVAPETRDWTLNLNALDFESSVTNHPEMPTVGTVEDWVWVNMTGDTHPMHTHLVTHQVIGRTPFDVDRFQADHGGPRGVPGGIDPTPYATGPMEPPDPTERGFKDTTKANPGYFTTVRAKFDLPTGVTAPQTYVYHCHIVEHEDNDMMLPFTVVP